MTVGGDDTASTANRIAKFLEAKKYPIANIHVPEDDRQRPAAAGQGTPTFGYESAKDKGAVIGTRRLRGRPHERQLVRTWLPWAAAPATWHSASARPATTR